MRTIGVLIPYFNDIQGLKSTLESFNESVNLLVLIVDDGSEAAQFPSDSFISSLINANTYRFQVESLGTNQGIEAALNYGLDYLARETSVEYIMRIDSGDICINGRIQKQLEFLEKNPGICLVGSQVEYVNENGEHMFQLDLPLDHGKIKKHIHKAVPFIHSAIMFRKTALSSVGRYSLDYPAAEDYALFFEFVKHCTTANLPETLTRVVWNTRGISVLKRRRQMRSRLKLLIENARFDVHSVYGIIRLVIIMAIPLPVLQMVKTTFRK